MSNSSMVVYGNATVFQLNVQSFSENNSVKISEKIIIPNPDDVTDISSTLLSLGHNRSTITISGFTTFTDYGFFKDALKYYKKILMNIQTKFKVKV